MNPGTSEPEPVWVWFFVPPGDPEQHVTRTDPRDGRNLRESVPTLCGREEKSPPRTFQYSHRPYCRECFRRYLYLEVTRVVTAQWHH